MGSEKNVFLSYSRKDVAYARQIQNGLKARGHQAWLDLLELRPGQEWWDLITEKILNSDVVIFLASQDSTASEFCRAELKYAIALRRTVIPVIVGALTFDELPDQLRSRQSLRAGIAADEEELWRAILAAPRSELPHPLPPQPRLPASMPSTASAFLDPSFRRDLEEIRQLVERGEWKAADERTRDAVLGLSGAPALKRRHLKRGYPEDETRDLPCDGLEALASIWAGANPPMDEEERWLPYRQVRGKIEYPTAWVPRKAELESPLYDERDGFAARCESCGVEPFVFYARPDGELLFVPERIVLRRFEGLASPAVSLLRFCSFFRTFWADIEIDQLAIGAEHIDEAMEAFLKKSSDPSDELRTLIESLFARNLVRHYDGKGFNTHEFIDNWLHSRMDEAERSRWKARVLHVLAYLTTRIPVGQHWLKFEVERQLEGRADTASRAEKAADKNASRIISLRRWLTSAQ